MKIFKLSRKNVFETWWRSLTLGIFIFLATLLLLFFNSFVQTMQGNLNDALSHSLTGDVQLRPGATEETDMFTQSGNWGDTKVLTGDQVSKIEKALNDQVKPADYTKRIRMNVLLSSGTKKQPVMVIGLDTKSKTYEGALDLKDGKLLSSGDGIVLPELYAKKLEVKPGDKIDVMAQDKDGKPVMAKRTVVGIADVQKLSSFGFNAAYMDLKGASDLMGYKNGEVTDVIAFMDDRSKADKMASDATDALKAAGLAASDVKVTTWSDMGGFIKSTIGIYVGMFYAFIAILLIIMSILIINLISMMGLERRQEIGTLRAIGFSRSKIVSVFMGEVFIITSMFFLLGSVLGIVLVLVLSNVGMTVPTPMDTVLGKEFFMKFDITQIIPVVVIIYGFTMLASLYPSLKAASIRPAETLREM